MKILTDFVDGEIEVRTCQGEVLETYHNTPIFGAIFGTERGAVH
jgi:hypothetical protein